MDPNPIKHPAVLLARVRDAVEPALASAGFRFNCRNRPQPICQWSSLWIDYTKGDDTISVRFDHGTVRIVAELLDGHGHIATLAEADLGDVRTTSELMSHFKSFVDAINLSLRSV